MARGLGFFVMRTAYPEMDPGSVQEPDVELVAAWDCDGIWELVAASAEDLPLMAKVWSAKPTMVHPTHVAALGAELAFVLERLGAADETTRDEMDRARTLCGEVSEAGGWLVTIGP